MERRKIGAIWGHEVRLSVYGSKKRLAEGWDRAGGLNHRWNRTGNIFEGETWLVRVKLAFKDEFRRLPGSLKVKMVKLHFLRWIMWTYVAFSLDRQRGEWQDTVGKEWRKWNMLNLHFKQHSIIYKIHTNFCITVDCKHKNNNNKKLISPSLIFIFPIFLTLFCPLFIPYPSSILSLSLSSWQRWSNPLIHYLQRQKKSASPHKHTYTHIFTSTITDA